MNLADLSHIIVDMEETMLQADGFDEAILGTAKRCGQTDIIAYDVAKIIDILMTRDGMDYEEAIEYFEFNILGGWHGEGTPCFVFTDEKEDILDEINWNQESN